MTQFKAHRNLVRDRLDYFYKIVKGVILSRQNPVTGLIPASVAVTTHGDYRDAWVRDNVYSIMAVFGLALAYRRIDDESGRAYELEHAVTKCMRGLLFSMMRQAHKVELFKKTQHILHSLHAKYNTQTGDTVVGDAEWGHLQVDATSIFLLSLAQMTASGFHIIYNQDEVDFIQNLVYYIERAYRTPDYGIWERGNKINHGMPELNSSSIGMVVAALQAMNGLNLFGSRGGPSSVIHCLPDEITRNYTVLHSSLPRESNSKEVDAALLSVIGFPAFAVQDPDLIQRTRDEIVTKLGGKYGCKRFLRDGHQTIVEDTSRLHYDPHELLIFEGIECEWPLFFTYLILDGLFYGNVERADTYIKALEPCLVSPSILSSHDNDGPQDPATKALKDLGDDVYLVPELFIVPREAVNAEKANPHSQKRIPNENIPLVWAQSLYLLGQLLRENLLSPAEVDPLGRRMLPYWRTKQHVDTVVQIVLLAEDAALQAKLAVYGLDTQTLDQVGPITVARAPALREVYTTLGANEKLGLTGRPKRPIGTLGTCKVYKIQGQLYAFEPHFLETEEFYLSSDNEYLISVFEDELSFVKANWFSNGRPTMVVVMRHSMLSGFRPSKSRELSRSIPRAHSHRRNLMNFFMSLRSGVCGSVRVRLGRLSEVINTACVESLDFLADKNVDWETILQKNRPRMSASKLHFSEQLTTESLPIERKLSRRKSIESIPTPSLLSPIERKESEYMPYTPSTPYSLYSPYPLDDFKLNDNGDAMLEKKRNNTTETSPVIQIPGYFDHSLDRQRLSPVKDTGSIHRTHSPSARSDTSDAQLSLIPGDATSVPEAINALQASNNLYEQIDILHYLESCHGLAFFIPQLNSTVANLLEEVYQRALRLKLWSIVRQAAGLLKKMVNSLTINLTDLLIRQKQVTLGANMLADGKIGQNHHEFVITTPLGPAALGEVIFKNSSGDVREGPLVQEILTCLGTFVRADPSLFDGILRLRTFYLIIALREEILRTKGCDEMEAIETLMQMSPFEIKNLLCTVLSNPTVEASSILMPETIPKGPRGRAQSVFLNQLSRSLKTANVEQQMTRLDVLIQSAGFLSGNFARIEINGQSIGLSGRGLNVVVLDSGDGAILESASYDTHFSSAESEEFASLAEWLDPQMIVVVCGKDDFVENLTDDAKELLERLGSKFIRKCQYRDSWCLVGRLGGTDDNVFESYQSASAGPSDLIHHVFDLAAPHNTLFSPDARWLRKRKNDGALNRVPQKFYPRVWRVLESSNGIQVYNVLLPRNPTVSESTPEEFNFAIRVEATLDVIRDPAERVIAAETLMVIHKLLEVNHGVKIGQTIDLMKLVTNAMTIFWDVWVTQKRQTNEAILSSVISTSSEDLKDSPNSSPDTPAKTSPNGTSYGILVKTKTKSSKTSADYRFEKNERLARRLFYDLPMEGKEGTTWYLMDAVKAKFPQLAKPFDM
ncbi:glycosyl hydrolases family 15-domain-containing protein [Paraphysoderma sedebokerense]|nr:glycosyl hydrolases family 15-domain-containing protein [Paraphysoderma sedebokerense]